MKTLKQRKDALAIAKDVIAQLNAKKYIARSGVYLKTAVTLKEGDLQKQLLAMGKKGKKCTVCAVGSMFCSKVRRDDQFALDEYQAGYTYISDDGMRELLESAFTYSELGEIEFLFERENMTGGEGDYESLAFGLMESISNDEARLRILMLEVIRQKGYFEVEAFDGYLSAVARKAQIAAYLPEKPRRKKKH